MTAYLTGATNNDLDPLLGRRDHLGLLVTPDTKQYVSRLDAWNTWAADNAMFGWYLGKKGYHSDKAPTVSLRERWDTWITFLESVPVRHRERCLFATVPDHIPGPNWDRRGPSAAEATLFAFKGFAQQVADLGYKPAFVAQDGLEGPSSFHADEHYKRLGSILGRARLAGAVSWDAIEDRTRSLRKLSHWSSPGDSIDAVAGQFRLDKWEGQDSYLEVWIEKDALVGVIEEPCEALDVPYFSCRGYGSLSEIWGAGRRMKQQVEAGRRVVVVHLGDHDPSGIDMTRDIEDRLSLFAESPVQIERIALNMDQVERYGPPPNPAKVSDSRYESYAREHGRESWELDALEPDVLQALVRHQVGVHLDIDMFEARAEEQARGRELLAEVAERWRDVVEFLGTRE